MSFLCCDDTAAIQVTLWNEALASFKRQFDVMPSDTPIIMEMTTFKVTKMKENSWKTKILSSMQQIESVRSCGKQKRTVLTLSEWTSRQSESPFLHGKKFVMPPSTICITNFASVGPALFPPCRGSFAGIVQQVSPKQKISKKDDELDFTLIDDHGAWIQCCAMGILTDTDVIAEGIALLASLALVSIMMMQRLYF